MFVSLITSSHIDFLIKLQVVEFLFSSHCLIHSFAFQVTALTFVFIFHFSRVFLRSLNQRWLNMKFDYCKTNFHNWTQKLLQNEFKCFNQKFCDLNQMMIKHMKKADIFEANMKLIKNVAFLQKCVEKMQTCFEIEHILTRVSNSIKTISTLNALNRYLNAQKKKKHKREDKMQQNFFFRTH